MDEADSYDGFVDPAKPPHAPASEPRRFTSPGLLLGAGAVLLAFLWSVNSPVGASPDEPAHIAYAWGTATGQTVVGEKIGRIASTKLATRVDIPLRLLQYPAPHCYNFRPAQPVFDCRGVPPDTLERTPVMSYMTRYPPLFYALDGVVLRAGVAMGLSGPRVLYLARFSAMLFAIGSVAAGIGLLRRRFALGPVILGAAFGLPPLAWFIAGTINSSGLETAGGFLLAAAVVSVRADTARGHTSRAAIAAVPIGVLVLAWTRPLSFVWAALVVALLLVPVIGNGAHVPGSGAVRARRLWPLRTLGPWATGATIVVLAAATAWFFWAVGLRNPGQESRDEAAAWNSLSPWWRIGLVGLRFGGIVREQIGTFGWLDTPMPDLLAFVWLAVAVGVLFVWFAGGTRTVVPRWGVGAVVGLACLAAATHELVTEFGWQGRYLLPVTAAAGALAVPGIAAGLERVRRADRSVVALLATVTAVHAIAALWFLWRNMYGLRVWSPSRIPAAPLPIGRASWSPPGGHAAMLVLVLAAVTLAVSGTVRLASRIRSDARAVPGAPSRDV